MNRDFTVRILSDDLPEIDEVNYTNVPLYHYTSVPLYHYTLTPMLHYAIIPMFHYTIIPMFLIPLHQCSLYHTPMFHYTNVYHYTNVPFYHYTNVPCTIIHYTMLPVIVSQVFYVTLFGATGGARVGNESVAKITILANDKPYGSTVSMDSMEILTAENDNSDTSVNVSVSRR